MRVSPVQVRLCPLVRIPQHRTEHQPPLTPRSSGGFVFLARTPWDRWAHLCCRICCRACGTGPIRTGDLQVMARRDRLRVADPCADGMEGERRGQFGLPARPPASGFRGSPAATSSRRPTLFRAFNFPAHRACLVDQPGHRGVHIVIGKNVIGARLRRLLTMWITTPGSAWRWKSGSRQTTR